MWDRIFRVVFHKAMLSLRQRLGTLRDAARRIANALGLGETRLAVQILYIPALSSSPRTPCLGRQQQKNEIAARPNGTPCPNQVICGFRIGAGPQASTPSAAPCRPRSKAPLAF